MSSNNDRNSGLEDEKSSTIGTSDRHSTVNLMDEGERDSPVFRESAERPILKLSVRLIDTYKNINKVSSSNRIEIPQLPIYDFTLKSCFISMP